MRIFEKFTKFLRKPENKAVSINHLVVLPDKTQVSVGQLIYMSGQYGQLKKTNNDLMINIGELQHKVARLQFERDAIELQPQAKVAAKQIPQWLTKDEQLVLNLLKNEEVTVQNLKEKLDTIEALSVKSMPSYYRILKKLKDKKHIHKVGSVYHVLENSQIKADNNQNNESQTKEMAE